MCSQYREMLNLISGKSHMLQMQGEKDYVEKRTREDFKVSQLSRALFLDVLHQVIKYNKKYKIMPKQV